MIAFVRRDGGLALQRAPVIGLRAPKSILNLSVRMELGSNFE